MKLLFGTKCDQMAMLVAFPFHVAERPREQGQESKRMGGGSVLDNLTVCPPPFDVQGDPSGFNLEAESNR